MKKKEIIEIMKIELIKRNSASFKLAAELLQICHSITSYLNGCHRRLLGTVRHVPKTSIIIVLVS